MERIAGFPRSGWRAAVEADGLKWHTRPDGSQAWDERAHWAFTAAEIETLYEAANEMHAMCVDAAKHVVETRLWPLLGLDETQGAAVARSWKTRDRELSLCGRLEIGWGGAGVGDGSPKLLGFNADTPDGLLEASLAQWSWKEATHPASDQFNGLHEALGERLAAQVTSLTRAGPWAAGGTPTLYATAMPGDPAGKGQMDYLVRLATEAGLQAQFIGLPDIGWDPDGERFVDLDEAEMRLVAHHHPWQWLIADPFGNTLLQQVAAERVEVMEPAWRMVMANKAILSVLWELYPHHPYLAEARLDRRGFAGGADIVVKPKFGMGGVGVRLGAVGADGRLAVAESVGSDAAFEAEGEVVQARVPLATADGRTAVFGVWMVGDEARGLGVREGGSAIVGADAAFVPHRFD